MRVVIMSAIRLETDVLMAESTLVTVLAGLRPLPFFPVGARNFAGLGKLSIKKMVAADSEETMHGLIYLVGLIVVILAILSFFGLR